MLDGSGGELPTGNPNGFDSFLEVDLPTTGSGEATIVSASPAYGIGDPTLTSESSVPEPSGFVLLMAVACLSRLLYRGGRWTRPAAY